VPWPHATGFPSTIQPDRQGPSRHPTHVFAGVATAILEASKSIGGIAALRVGADRRPVLDRPVGPR